MRPYKCNMCGNIGMRQLCREHKVFHGHGMVHIDKIYKEDCNAWWLCNKCSEREQYCGVARYVVIR